MSRELETVTVKIHKVINEDGPSHWTVDVEDIDGSLIGGGTAPDFYGVWDMANEIVTGDMSNLESRHNKWVDFNANK